MKQIGLVLLLLLALAGCSTEQGPQTSSEPVSQAAASGSRNRAKVHTELASLYFQNGNMAVAIEEIRVALSADSSYAPAYNVRGLVHMYLKEVEAAEESFQKALDLAAGDPEINNNYGWFLCQTGRQKQSLGYFMAAVKNPLYSTPEKSYVNAGMCAMQANDFKAADDYLQKALRLGRNSGAARTQLAALRYRTSDYGQAKELLAALHRDNDPTAESLWLAVRVERKLGDRLSEVGFANQLRRSFPDSQEARELKRGNFE